MISNKCPCCGKSISLISFIKREKKDEEFSQIICTSCHKNIQFKELKSPHPGTHTFLFFIFLFLIFIGITSNFIIILAYVGFTLIISTYIQYLYTPVKCDEIKNADYIEFSTKKTIWLIVITGIFFLLFLGIQLFSFATHMKENKKQNKIEQTSHIEKFEKDSIQNAATIL